MHYLTVSFSYKNADLSIREKLSFDENSKKECLKKLLQSPSINEAVLLATYVIEQKL